MLLYVSSEEHQNVVDRIDELGIIKKMVGEYDLLQLLVKDNARLRNFRIVLLDVYSALNTSEGFIEAIESFIAINEDKIRLILYAPEVDTNIIKKLIEIGIYNIITTKEFPEMEWRLKKAVEVGYTKEEALLEHLNIREKEEKEMKEKLHTFLCKGIEVGVYGMERNVGTTTLTLNISKYLSQKGATVICYGIESEELKSLAEDWGLEMQDNHVVVNDRLRIYPNEYPLKTEVLQNINFLIADLGIPGEKIYNAKKTIFVSYGREKDIQAIESSPVKDEVDHYILRGVKEKDEEKLRKRLLNKVYFLKDGSESIEGKVINEAEYSAIFQEYML